VNEDAVDKVLERLDQLGEISIQGFEVIVRQMVIEGFISLAWGGFWALVTIAVFIIAKKTFDNTLFPEAYAYENGYSSNRPWSMAYAFVGVALTLTALNLVAGGIRRLINPEYFAIEYIFRQFGG